MEAERLRQRAFLRDLLNVADTGIDTSPTVLTSNIALPQSLSKVKAKRKDYGKRNRTGRAVKATQQVQHDDAGESPDDAQNEHDPAHTYWENLLVDSEYDSEADRDVGKQASGNRHAISMQKQYDAWTDRFTEFKASPLQRVPAVQMFKQYRRSQHIDMVQEYATDSFVLHQQCKGSAVSIDDFDCLGLKDITYLSFNTRHQIHVPVYQCKTCKQVVQATPEHIGCWPSTPVDAYTWIDEDVLFMYQQLSQRDGTSATGRRTIQCLSWPVCDDALVPMIHSSSVHDESWN